MNKFSLFILFFTLTLSQPVRAQASFPDKVLGIWEGEMLLYQQGHVYDSVAVRLSISKTDTPQVYGWKTEYLSKKYPIAKDYQLKLLDGDQQVYAMDEGDGIVLKAYVFDNKLYSTFAANGNMLSSSYELRNDKLIFEISYGKLLDETEGVNNYSVNSLQKAVMRRTN